MKARIHIAPDGTLTGTAAGLPVGEHEAEITLLNKPGKNKLDPAALLRVVRQIQREIAALPVLDHRSSDEIIGYKMSTVISTDGNRQFGDHRLTARRG